MPEEDLMDSYFGHEEFGRELIPGKDKPCPYCGEVN
jgi:hypothetical protein